MSTDVLVTGGAGFIGSSVVRTALGRGHRVRVLDNLSTGAQSNLEGLDVELIEGSITDPQDVRRAVEGAGAVIHLAALPSVPRSLEDPLATNFHNVTGTLTLLEGMRDVGVQVIAAASSSSVYGRNPRLPKNEEDWIAPMSPYAVSKLATEQYVLAYQVSFGFRTTAFRFFNVYGPRQPAGVAYSAVVPSFVDAMLRGKTLTVHGDGEQSRDFTYVDSVADTLLSAVEQQLKVQTPINLAFGTNTTLLELVRELEGVTGLTADLEFVESRTGDVRHSQADASVLRQNLPCSAPVPLRDGLEATVTWHRARGAGSQA